MYLGSEAQEYCSLPLIAARGSDSGDRRTVVTYLEQIYETHPPITASFVDFDNFGEIVLTLTGACHATFPRSQIDRIVHLGHTLGLRYRAGEKYTPRVVDVVSGERISSLEELFDRIGAYRGSIVACSYVLEVDVSRLSSEQYQRMRDIIDESVLKIGLPILHVSHYNGTVFVIFYEQCGQGRTMMQILRDEVHEEFTAGTPIRRFRRATPAEVQQLLSAGSAR